MTGVSEEADLISRAREGESEAFARLVRLHEANIRRLATGLLMDPDEAEDAAQEVFIKAHKSLPRFRGESRFSTWLHRITVNHCRDVLRRKRWPSWEGLIETLGGEPATAASQPDQAGRAVEARDHLERLLGGLPPHYRAILLLRELNGLSYREIAETLGTSEDSVRAKLRRARAAALEARRH